MSIQCSYVSRLVADVVAAFALAACCAGGVAAQTIARAGGGLSTSPFQSDARWIAAQADAPAATTAQGNVDAAATVVPLPIFRHSFTVRGKTGGAKLVSATLNISGLGQFEAHINGHNVTEAVLTPGWSDYRKRIYYDTYDVTKLVVPGENAIGVMLGNGMYNVESPANRYTKFRGTVRRAEAGRCAGAAVHGWIGAAHYFGWRVEDGGRADHVQQHLRRRGLRRAIGEGGMGRGWLR